VVDLLGGGSWLMTQFKPCCHNARVKTKRPAERQIRCSKYDSLHWKSA